MTEYGREGGPGWAHLILIKVKSSHSLLAEIVVWQHPIHCLCEGLCVCVCGERGRGRGGELHIIKQSSFPGYMQEGKLAMQPENEANYKYVLNHNLKLH